jgi:hypothetical protein
VHLDKPSYRFHVLTMAVLSDESSVDDAVSWLTSLPGKFQQYEAAMRAEQLDGARLFSISTDDLLVLLSVTSFGHKLLIKKHHTLLLTGESSNAKAEEALPASHLSQLAQQTSFQHAFATETETAAADTDGGAVASSNGAASSPSIAPTPPVALAATSTQSAPQLTIPPTEDGSSSPLSQQVRCPSFW